MSGFLSVFKRELRGYFSTPLAYVFIVLFLVMSVWLTFAGRFFDDGQASLHVFFSLMPMLFIFLAPAIAMRLWAEERRTNSIEMLFSLPLTTTQAVLGKFFAAWSVIALALAMTWPMVVTVYYLGRPDGGPIVTGYLATLLLAGAYLAMGSFFSSLTRNQVIAFVLAVVACGFFLYAGSPSALGYLVASLPDWLVDLAAGAGLELKPAVAEVAETLSLQSRFESLERGVIELRDVALFVFLIAGWLWANVVALKERMATG